MRAKLTNSVVNKGLEGTSKEPPSTAPASNNDDRGYTWLHSFLLLNICFVIIVFVPILFLESRLAVTPILVLVCLTVYNFLNNRIKKKI